MDGEEEKIELQYSKFWRENYCRNGRIPTKVFPWAGMFPLKTNTYTLNLCWHFLSHTWGAKGKVVSSHGCKLTSLATGGHGKASRSQTTAQNVQCSRGERERQGRKKNWAVPSISEEHTVIKWEKLQTSLCYFRTFDQSSFLMENRQPKNALRMAWKHQVKQTWCNKTVYPLERMD